MHGEVDQLTELNQEPFLTAISLHFMTSSIPDHRSGFHWTVLIYSPSVSSKLEGDAALDDSEQNGPERQVLSRVFLHKTM